ncbi:MAG: bifunctional MaoC family dehydratase/OB-fold nucleic acid binding domain-containing protein [Halioglobus sp.]|nr:bifunctional MaoC family dehydratase/OB-fold nucleic acid binding domain-containing protein [Halioglobus sp.]
MSDEQAEFKAKMQSYVDRGDEGIKTSWDDVNRPMIRHWAQAMGDNNPIYTDAEFAAGTRHGGLVAPPTMIQAWTMKGLDGQAPGSSTIDPMAEASELMVAAGYVAVVATNCEQRYLRYVKPGEKLHHRYRLESISDEKKTGLGTGYFMTQLLEYCTEEGEKVAEMRFTILRYKPGKREPKRPPRARPGMTRDTEFFWQGLHEQNKLLIQRCASCKTLRHPPAPMCPSCRSLEHDTVEASGRGTLYSHVTMHYPPLPAFEYPNTIALVELEEGTRLLAGLIDLSAEDLEIGMPLQLEIVRCDDELTVPMFRRAQ